MGVFGLTRVESATRRRSCGGDSLAPTPASVGAMLPEACSPGTAWHRVQAPASRFTTMLRPRAASPGSEARACGIASPITSRRTGGSCAAPPAAPHARSKTQAGGLIRRVSPRNLRTGLPYASVSPWVFSGSQRMRLPVAAKIAVATPRALDDGGGIAAVGLGLRDAAEHARGKRLAPAGRFRGRLEHPEVPRGFLEQRAAVLVRILAGGARQFVHEGFAHERVLRVADGAPEADRHVRIALGVLDPDVRHRVRQVVERGDRLRVDAFGRRERRL